MIKTIVLACLLAWATALSQAQDATPKPVAPFTPAVLVGNTLYLSGQLPRIPETGEMIKGDVRKATEQCMKNIGTLLKDNKMDYSDLAMVNIYMASMDHYKTINDIYASYFKDGKFPARVAVQVARLPFDVDIEISAIAAKK